MRAPFHQMCTFSFVALCCCHHSFEGVENHCSCFPKRKNCLHRCKDSWPSAFSFSRIRQNGSKSGYINTHLFLLVVSVFTWVSFSNGSFGDVLHCRVSMPNAWFHCAKSCRQMWGRVWNRSLQSVRQSRSTKILQSMLHLSSYRTHTRWPDFSFDYQPWLFDFSVWLVWSSLL